jgi:hypothetical protein
VIYGPRKQGDMLAVVALPLAFLNRVQDFSLALFVVVSDVSKFFGDVFGVAIERQKAFKLFLRRCI